MKWETREELLETIEKSIVSTNDGKFTLSPQFLLSLPTKTNLKKKIRESYEQISNEIAIEIYNYMTLEDSPGRVPPGLSLKSGHSYKVSKKILARKLQQFFEVFEDEYSKEEVIAAHKMYTNHVLANFGTAYLPTSAHAIIKQNNDGDITSFISDIMEGIRDGSIDYFDDEEDA